MKNSLIYITAGVAAVGFAVPAFAAHGDTPEHIEPTPGHCRRPPRPTTTDRHDQQLGRAR